MKEAPLTTELTPRKRHEAFGVKVHEILVRIQGNSAGASDIRDLLPEYELSLSKELVEKIQGGRIIANDHAGLGWNAAKTEDITIIKERLEGKE